jgi:hypothetical protein
MPAGTYYYPVLRDDLNGAVGPYVINVTCAGAVPCDPATNLTVIRGIGLPDNVTLRWNATQTTGFYKVFGTTVKNNSGDPNDGSWGPPLSTQPAPGAPGVMTYTHAPLVPYMNYAVVHDCTPVCVDFFLTAPGTVSGNTTGAGDNCNLRVGEEQIVAVTIPTAGQWSFSLCPTGTWDTYIYLTTACCGGTTLAQNDDYCSLTSEIHCFAIAAAGTYYLDIEPWSGGSGPWTLIVSACAPPPPLVCPPVHVNENEPVCYDEYVDVTNGGCNATPPVFGSILCGQTMCGEYGTFLYTGLSYRDTDWINVTPANSGTLTWTVQAQYGVMIAIMTWGPPPTPCTGFTYVYAIGGALVPTTITLPGAVGGTTYGLFVAPDVFTGVPCGSDWVGTVTCP